MVKITLLLALGCLVLIIYMIREHRRSTERLTGRWYRRRKIGFVDYEIIVEFKVNRQRFTRIATKTDLEVLKKKFKITDFKTLKN